jgi:hypothetical protein
MHLELRIKAAALLRVKRTGMCLIPANLIRLQPLVQERLKREAELQTREMCAGAEMFPIAERSEKRGSQSSALMAKSRG